MAVVVFGEQPYAEYAGDRPDHALNDEEGFALLRKFRAAHVPTVAVLLSGRPLWVNREIAEADAFVAAWLPGSEGEGVADVLLGDANGRPAKDFIGRLPFHWPSDCNDSAAPLLPLGAGGSYAHAPILPKMSLSCGNAGQGDTILFRRALGLGVTGYARSASAPSEVILPGFVGATSDRAVSVTSYDAKAQEDGRKIVWQAPGEVILRLDHRVDGAGKSLALEYAFDQQVAGRVTVDIGFKGKQVVLTPTQGQSWGHLSLPLQCLGATSLDALRFSAEAPVTLRITSLAIVPSRAGEPCDAHL